MVVEITKTTPSSSVEKESEDIISGRGRGRLSNENNNNNFGNHFEGIRKYIEVIIFRFIIKNFLFITVY